MRNHCMLASLGVSGSLCVRGGPWGRCLFLGPWLAVAHPPSDVSCSYRRLGVQQRFGIVISALHLAGYC